MNKLIASFCAVLFLVSAPIKADEKNLGFPGGTAGCTDVLKGINAVDSGDFDSVMGMLGVYVAAYMAGVMSGWNMGQMNRSLLKQPSYRLAGYDAETRMFLLKKYCRKNSSAPLLTAIYFSVIGPMVVGQVPQIQTYDQQ